MWAYGGSLKLSDSNQKQPRTTQLMYAGYWHPLGLRDKFNFHAYSDLKLNLYLFFKIKLCNAAFISSYRKQSINTVRNATTCVRQSDTEELNNNSARNSEIKFFFKIHNRLKNSFVKIELKFTWKTLSKDKITLKVDFWPLDAFFHARSLKRSFSIRSVKKSKSHLLGKDQKSFLSDLKTVVKCWHKGFVKCAHSQSYNRRCRKSRDATFYPIRWCLEYSRPCLLSTWHEKCV
jgi:hypothetical protein